jgi:hypothetical protein
MMVKTNINYNVKNKYCNDMRDKIESIVLQYSLTDSEASQLTDELLNLFSVMNRESLKDFQDNVTRESYDWDKGQEYIDDL